MKMIEADKVIPLIRLLLMFHPNAERILEDMQSVVDIHTIDAVPASELLELRDWLYENDAITMRGLAKLNVLIAKMQVGGAGNG